MNSWVRLWHDMPTDPKFRTIARASGQPLAVVLSVFVYMLTDASANEVERGAFRATDEDIASALDLPDDAVVAIRQAMQGRVLDGNVLTGWAGRQPAREDGSAERAKAWREQKRAEAQQGERTQTQANAPERPDTEADTEEEDVANATSVASGDVDLAVKAYNEMAVMAKLAIPRSLTPERRRKVQSILRRHGMDAWREALAKVAASDFCLGLGDRGWRADLDFLLQPSKFVQLLEGKFDNRAPQPRGSPQRSRPPNALEELFAQGLTERLGNGGYGHDEPAGADRPDAEQFPGLTIDGQAGARRLSGRS